MSSEFFLPPDQMRELTKSDDERHLETIMRQKIHLDELIEDSEDLSILVPLGDRLHRAYVTALILDYVGVVEEIRSQLTACAKRIHLLQNRSKGIVTAQ